MEGEPKCYLVGRGAYDTYLGKLMGREDHSSSCVEGHHWNWSFKSHIRKTELFLEVHTEETMQMRCFVAHLCPSLWHEHGHHHLSLPPTMQVRTTAAAYTAPIAAAVARAATAACASAAGLYSCFFRCSSSSCSCCCSSCCAFLLPYHSSTTRLHAT